MNNKKALRIAVFSTALSACYIQNAICEVTADTLQKIYTAAAYVQAELELAHSRSSSKDQTKDTFRKNVICANFLDNKVTALKNIMNGNDFQKNKSELNTGVKRIETRINQLGKLKVQALKLYSKIHNAGMPKVDQIGLRVKAIINATETDDKKSGKTVAAMEGLQAPPTQVGSFSPAPQSVNVEQQPNNPNSSFQNTMQQQSSPSSEFSGTGDKSRRKTVDVMEGLQTPPTQVGSFPPPPPPQVGSFPPPPPPQVGSFPPPPPPPALKLPGNKGNDDQSSSASRGIVGRPGSMPSAVSSSLLSGVELKKVETNDRSTPRVEKNASGSEKMNSGISNINFAHQIANGGVVLKPASERLIDGAKQVPDGKSNIALEAVAMKGKLKKRQDDKTEAKPVAQPDVPDWLRKRREKIGE